MSVVTMDVYRAKRSTPKPAAPSAQSTPFANPEQPDFGEGLFARPAALAPRSAGGRGGAERPVRAAASARVVQAWPPVAVQVKERQPAGRPVPLAARDLLAEAQRGLGTALGLTLPAERYAAAHLAALRAAAAVLAARARPGRARRASAWDLLSRVAPEFGEWAAFFAAGSAKRQAAQAGITRLITARDADDMVRQCAAFVDLVDDALR